MLWDRGHAGREGRRTIIRQWNYAAYACILAVVFLWGSAAAVGRYLGDTGTPLTLAVWRLALGFGLLLAIRAGIALKNRISKRGRQGSANQEPAKNRGPVGKWTRDCMPIWVAGIVGYGAMLWLFFAAARTTLASHLVLIMSMAPICTMLMSRLAGAPLRSGQYGAAAVSLVGVAVIASPSVPDATVSLEGDLLALLAMIAFSAYTVMTGRLGARTASLNLNLHAMAAGLVSLLAAYGIVGDGGGFGGILGGTSGKIGEGLGGELRGGLGGGFNGGLLENLLAVIQTPEQGLAIGYLGIASTGLAYLLYSLALARLPMGRVVPFIFLQPVVGVVLAAVWLGEALTIKAAIGMAAILGGLIWNHRLTLQPQPLLNRRTTTNEFPFH
ncbi:DMT family transporter [Cohnella fermenti]|uniref:DMT family transporter n=1 Tax=Cohnella fermenti TaxID=2565925 RepID=A0A4S4BF42_9BACL|nr:DMT family transporter [Cohnella fermenti]THF72903.1 DMT family transporter [Cohnella fermenti]